MQVLFSLRQNLISGRHIRLSQGQNISVKNFKWSKHTSVVRRKKSALHRAIDDATGISAGAWFNLSTKRKLTRIWLKIRRSLLFVRNTYRLMTAFDDVKFEFIQKKRAVQ